MQLALSTLCGAFCNMIYASPFACIHLTHPAFVCCNFTLHQSVKWERQSLQSNKLCMHASHNSKHQSGNIFRALALNSLLNCFAVDGKLLPILGAAAYWGGRCWKRNWNWWQQPKKNFVIKFFNLSPARCNLRLKTCMSMCIYTIMVDMAYMRRKFIIAGWKSKEVLSVFFGERILILIFIDWTF